MGRQDEGIWGMTSRDMGGLSPEKMWIPLAIIFEKVRRLNGVHIAIHIYAYM